MSAFVTFYVEKAFPYVNYIHSVDRNYEDIMLYEMSKSQKDKYNLTHCYDVSEIHSWKQRVEQWLPGAEEREMKSC